VRETAQAVHTVANASRELVEGFVADESQVEAMSEECLELIAARGITRDSESILKEMASRLNPRAGIIIEKTMQDINNPDPNHLPTVEERAKALATLRSLRWAVSRAGERATGEQQRKLGAVEETIKKLMGGIFANTEPNRRAIGMRAQVMSTLGEADEDELTQFGLDLPYGSLSLIVSGLMPEDQVQKYLFQHYSAEEERSSLGEIR